MSGSSSTAGWNYGDILDAVDATVDPARPALIHADRVVQWRDFTRRTNNLARALRDRGAQPGDKIAFYMRNCAQYSEAYRRGVQGATDPRQRQLPLRRSGARSICSTMPTRQSSCTPPSSRRACLRFGRRLPNVMQWIEVADGYPGTEDASTTKRWPNAVTARALGHRTAGDDMLFLYTGGTTGMPKGVMWRHDDLWQGTGAGGNPRIGVPPSPDLATYIERLRAEVAAGQPAAAADDARHRAPVGSRRR